ncbi:MAG: glutathione synthase [Ancalomicrobiaceae bacterium]|nr:glutathione synthase [Ancalomicrobiaceae bacterium]
MPLDVAVQMDHISTIRFRGDSTFALLLEAQKRGHRLWHYTPDRLALAGGKLYSTLEALTVRDVEGDYFTLEPPERVELDTMDVVLLRQDPPFDLNYITSTHLLERIHPKTLVVNDPVAVRNAPEKVLVTEFPELMPPTLITRDPDEIARFRAEFRDVVMKPLYGYGGGSVFRLREEDENYGSLVDLFSMNYREPWVIQQYRPEVRLGDKRIILVDGDYAGAVNRIPAANDLRSNMVRGGQAAGTDLTEREREIIAAIGPTLRRQGLLFVGIDVIGDYLTEINVTSPTGIRAIARLGGADIAALIWDKIEARRAG